MDMSKRIMIVLAGVVFWASGCDKDAGAAEGRWQNSLKPKGKIAKQLTLAENGKSDYVIVIPASATTQEQKAVEELSRWLAEMTGAKFPVINDSEPDRDKEINVGRTSRLSKANMAIAKQDLGDDGYGIAVKDKKLFLVGGRKRGPINAVLALLEEDLGCRWYTETVSRIPKRPTLKVKVAQRSYVPKLQTRDPRYFPTSNALWSLRNQVNGHLSPIPEEWGGHINYAPFVHTFNTLVPRDKYFEDHPEYFSEIQGQRKSTQLCLTNPKVVEIAAQSLLRIIRENPNAELASVSANDGGGFCRCENCSALDKAQGSHMGHVLPFVNQVAEIVEKEFPDVYVSTLAYGWTAPMPKTVRPRKNVAIRFCTDACMWERPFTSIADDTGPFRPDQRDIYWEVVDDHNNMTCKQEFLDWIQTDARIDIWDYPTNYSHWLAPMPNIGVIAENIRFFTQNGVTGVMEEAVPHAGGAARGRMRAWVFAKLMWDTSRNEYDLMQDYIYGYYGKAAPDIAKYNDLLWKMGEKFKADPALQTPEFQYLGCRYPMDSDFLMHGFLEQAKTIFDSAEASAEDKEILRRVELDRLPILYVEISRLHKQLKDTKSVPDKEYFIGLLDQFARIASEHNITRSDVGGIRAESVPDWIEGIKKAISQ